MLRTPATVFHCGFCTAQFDTYAKLCTHSFRKHSHQNLAQFYATSHVCRACLKMYHSRTQVLHHLKYQRFGCLLKLVLCTPPLSQDDLDAILTLEREQNQQRKSKQRKQEHHRPMQQSSGPLLPWPWQRMSTACHHDLHMPPALDPEQQQQFATEVLTAALTLSVPSTLQRLQRFDFHGNLAKAVLHAFDMFRAHPPTYHEAEVQIVLQEAISLWSDGIFDEMITDQLHLNRATASISLQRLSMIPGAPQVTKSSHVDVRQQVFMICGRKTM